MFNNLLTHKEHVQPVMSYGVLVHGASKKTLIFPLEPNTKQTAIKIINQPKLTSTCLERESNHAYSIRIMQIFDLLKKLTEILRANCQIDCLKNVITRKEIDTLHAK